VTPEPATRPDDLALRLAGGPPSRPADERALAGLRARLADAAAQADVLDVAYRTVDSPIGALLVAATPAGLVRVAFEVEGHDAVLDELARRISPRVLHAGRRLDAVAAELDAYFAGRLRVFTTPVDLRLASGFLREVLEQLRAVPYGATTSYTALAESAGRPAAVRAAGTACARNPVPLLVPCHRVVRRDGVIGNYRGGTDAKHLLLALEAAA
jgi:methylated-DNA-[protein]-cysteine S-methyltransferase